MKKIFYCLCALGLTLTGCEKETIKEPAPETPRVIVSFNGDLLLDGDNITVDMDKLPLPITSTAANVDVASYKWTVNNEWIESATTGRYTFDTDWSGTCPISIDVESTDSRTSTFDFTIDVAGPYKNGVVIYSSSAAALSFQSSGDYYDNLISKVISPGNGIATIQDIYLENNVMYSLLSNGKIVACDAQTFKKIEEYGTFSDIGTPFRMIKAAEGKYYISTDKIGSVGGGIWVYEKQADDSYAISSTAIAGTENAPASKPIKVGDYILVGNGDDIAVIDPATDALVDHDKNDITIIATRKVTDVFKGIDGYVYAAAYSTTSSVTSSVIKIDPADFSFIEEVELLVGASESKVSQTAWQSQSHGAASMSTNEIFIMGSDGIYSYNYGNGSTKKLASASFGYGTSGLNYMQMGADMDNVYYGTTDYSTSRIEKIDIATGSKSTLRAGITGDASVMTTYQFPAR